MLLRGPQQERLQLDMLGSLAVPTASGQSVPLSQIATLEDGSRRASSGTAIASPR